MVKIKLILAWLASHWDAFAVLFPFHWSRSWYFFKHSWAVGLTFDTSRKLRFKVDAEVGLHYFYAIAAVGPLQADLQRVVEF